jgi:hypothetical protein
VALRWGGSGRRLSDVPGPVHGDGPHDGDGPQDGEGPHHGEGPPTRHGR